MTDAISFNASVNIYVNDLANLSEHTAKSNCCSMLLDIEQNQTSNYKEKASLINLKIIGERCLLTASWRRRSCGESNNNDFIIGAYLNQDSKDGQSLIALWSLASPLYPHVIVNCNQKISSISFCPFSNYVNIVVGGSLIGQIIVWEIIESWLSPKKLENQWEYVYLHIFICNFFNMIQYKINKLKK